ncbi:ATP-dependent 6-phosphofructokinase [Auritidibacter sp. NML130574]|uniref:6-phosphofructokinase n=1 Tax=Auritidibacter TaxID=1160973 RepID=UPI000D727781|nr:MULTISPECIES: ATP-dependent 6-phosphofructokinase [Auritidibacter]AXR72986.1 ATP-dependent 6-phosphofructokinase [Auritidibacter sp. NML130574]WGH86131.1 ATP-dependent 6-phosphofructokinase [Auritidibacter ignavus]WGH88415.1 ATP-dependent 6-phosphofructokinase [Auritidibacter ignavus]
MRIGILTSGGDCPGLNAVIRSAVLHGIKSFDDELVGIRNGWTGLIDKDYFELPRQVVRGLARTGGTILGTSRTHPYNAEGGGPENIKRNMEDMGLGALIVIGGEGTLAGAQRLYQDGINLVGVPKTIDNDLRGTDYTFGFDTALSIATDAMDRLRTTGESHHRCMVAEVMGRHVGWIALHSGLSAGAHAILIPEFPTPMEQVSEWVTQVHERGRSPLVVVAEGFIPEGHTDPVAEAGVEASGRPRLGGIGEWVTHQIEDLTGIETRNTVLGHIQRGGAPTGYDRVLSTRFGMAAIDLIHRGHYGRMVSLAGTEIVDVDLDQALAGLKEVPQQRYDEAKVLFGR